MDPFSTREHGILAAPLVNRRRSLTPSPGIPIPGLPPTRRAGGARHNVSYRLTFFRGDDELPGWALNISRGGLRAVIEEHVEVGDAFEIQIGDELTRRKGQVVWTQEEPDGTIVGVSFLERLTEAPAGVDLDASIEISAPELAATMGVSEERLRELLDPSKRSSEGGSGEPGKGA